MATPTFAAARALGQGEVTEQAAAAYMSGQNADGTVYTSNVLTIPSAPGNVVGNSGVAVTGSATGANSAAAASLAAAAGKTTWITGFECTAAGSTAGLAVNVTVTGTITGTLNYAFTFPVGVLVPAPPLVVEFNPPIPSSAVNTQITVTLPAGGAGNTASATTVHGYQL